MNEQSETAMLESAPPDVAVVSEPTPVGPAPLVVLQGADVLPVKESPKADPPRHKDDAKAAAISSLLFHIRAKVAKHQAAGNVCLPDCFDGLSMTGQKIRTPALHPEVEKSVFDWFEEQGMTVDRQAKTINW